MFYDIPHVHAIGEEKIVMATEAVSRNGSSTFFPIFGDVGYSLCGSDEGRHWDLTLSRINTVLEGVANGLGVKVQQMGSDEIKVHSPRT